jgi:hypothetical protein
MNHLTWENNMTNIQRNETKNFQIKLNGKLQTGMTFLCLQESERKLQVPGCKER